MKAITMMKKAPVDWEKAVNRMNDREISDLRRAAEEISAEAAQLAGYLTERDGYGLVDQGHKKAVKTMNRNGKMVWMKVFGYNAYHEINI